MTQNYTNKIFIISGPSGAGEDSIIQKLKDYFPIEAAITTTSRSMRPKESPGHPYYFISRQEFKAGIKNNLFFEYAQQYNNEYYGITHQEIERIKNLSDKIGIWKIDYQGVITAKKLMPKIIAIFINAPLDVLEQRIRGRSNVTDEYIKERMEYTREWLKYRNIYDYEVINHQGKLDQAIQEVVEIIQQELTEINN
ncbi:MAG: hypothetical protein PHS07_01390 [Patescibacteria group bacterium]|jgi:guanylate kinase|nr:hypothetical protein [Patescibacteria group bacterium]